MHKVDELLDLLQSKRHIHFIGIGGVGMSGLACACVASGYKVSGTDLQMSSLITHLRKAGCLIKVGKQLTLPECDMVIISSAIREEHPELVAARDRDIPCFHRSELLGALMSGERTVGVTGTHGKTTTSALIAYLLRESRLNPTCFIGGELLDYGTNALIGDEDLVVAEVDESDKSLLNIHPSVAVLTNIEEDHLDVYSNIIDIQETFEQFINAMPEEGMVIYNADDCALSMAVKRTGRQTCSFGFSAGVMYRADALVHDAQTTSFDLYVANTFVTTVVLPLLGKHNVYNALAAIAACHFLGVDIPSLLPHLASFKGTGRRMQIKYHDADITVIDDYAHHPTEIAAILTVLQQKKRQDQELIVIYQPHRYTRTLHSGDTFGTCFEGADQVLITDIYAAGEEPIADVDQSIIVRAVKEQGSVPVAGIALDMIVPYLLELPVAKAVVAFVGAGDITEVADAFSSAIKSHVVGQ